VNGNAPLVNPKHLEEMTPAQVADHLTKGSLESLRRYAGRPDLLLKEHPHRDFRNPPKK
jgi:hypothetical protein